MRWKHEEEEMKNVSQLRSSDAIVWVDFRSAGSRRTELYKDFSFNSFFFSSEILFFFLFVNAYTSIHEAHIYTITRVSSKKLFVCAVRLKKEYRWRRLVWYEIAVKKTFSRGSIIIIASVLAITLKIFHSHEKLAFKQAAAIVVS